jgi:type II secretory pathway pseudopilin PulG
MTIRTSSRKRALSLADVLVVIVIVLALVSLGFQSASAALIASKRAEFSASLRQIGIATLLYVEQHGDYPISASILQRNMRLPESLFFNKEDVVADGTVTNMFSKSEPLKRNVHAPQFRSSVMFVGEGIITGEISEWDSFQERATNIAIAVSPLLEDAPNRQFLAPQPGSYFRLSRDGSVITRDIRRDVFRYQRPFENDPKSFYCLFGDFMFLDPSPADVQIVCDKQRQDRN